MKITIITKRMLVGRDVTGGALKWCQWGAADGTDDDQPDGQIAAATVAMMKNSTTCGPPTFKREKLAPNPIVVKKAIISGSRRVVSNVTRIRPWLRAIRTATARQR